MTVNKLAELAKTLGHDFQDVSLLNVALTHRSVRGDNNERLEFLGDSLLNFIIADELFQRYPKSREGELSRFRANLVNGKMLADIAQRFEIGNYLHLGAGELKSGGFQRKSIIADAIEAIIGAIYLDAGIEACRDCLKQWYGELFDSITTVGLQKDAKTRLQEYLQSKHLPLPEYVIVKTTGDAHAQTFHIECRVQGLPYATKGTETSRRAAEQCAAENFLGCLDV